MKRQEESEAENQVMVAKLDVDSIDSFSYMVDGITYSYQKNGEEWVCRDDISLTLDADSISDMLDNLKKVEAEEALTDYDDLSDYGLDSPQNSITVTCGETSKTFAIGDYNEMLAEYYLKVDGDDSVYLVDSTLMNAFSREPQSLVKAEEDTEE